MNMQPPWIVVRRHPYEEPHHTQIEIFVSDGRFLGSVDFYCNVSELKEIGAALQSFPTRVPQEYVYEYGSPKPEDRFYRHLVLRAYTVDAAGHCALQIRIDRNDPEPDEGMCQFSFVVAPAQLKRLGRLFSRFHDLEHLEFYWDRSTHDLYEEHQSLGARGLTSACFCNCYMDHSSRSSPPF
jgi:hypothetical protein